MKIDEFVHEVSLLMLFCTTEQGKPALRWNYDGF